MRASWGGGIAVGILLPVALYSLNIVPNLSVIFSLIFLLCGLWTLASAFFLVEPNERNYYAGWGVIIAVLSVFAYLPLAFAFGVLLLAVVVLIILYYVVGDRQRAAAVVPGPAAPTGGTPAAS